MRIRLWCLAVLAAAFTPVLLAQEWPQWGLNPQHTGEANIAGQTLNRNIVNVVYDPIVADELAGGEAVFGDAALFVHYQVPLVDGNDTYMMFKTGPFSINSYATQTWGETKFTWSGGTLVPVWQFTTDWKAPGTLATDFWEPVFHPALANGALYVPGKGGTLWKVNKSTGNGTRINPFSNMSNDRFVTSPLTVDSQGRILYTVVQLQNNTPDWFAENIVDAFLVRVSADDSTEKVS